MDSILQELENFCQKQHIPHRFVGGVSFGGLLNKETTWEINIKNRIIILKRHNQLNLLRQDGTIKDIDLILLTSDVSQKDRFLNFIHVIKNSYLRFPSISIELEKESDKHKTYLQFVTAIVKDKKEVLFLSFDAISERISTESLEPWKLILEDGKKITVRNPIGDYYAYQFRSPSGVKKKDKEKLMLLKNLTEDMIETGLRENIDFMSSEYYGAWQKYTEKLRMTHNKITVIKKYIMNIYWNTIGTSFAHESGIFGKLFSFLSDKFTG